MGYGDGSSVRGKEDRDDLMEEYRWFHSSSSNQSRHLISDGNESVLSSIECLQNSLIVLTNCSFSLSSLSFMFYPFSFLINRLSILSILPSSLSISRCAHGITQWISSSNLEGSEQLCSFLPFLSLSHTDLSPLSDCPNDISNSIGELLWSHVKTRNRDQGSGIVLRLFISSE